MGEKMKVSTNPHIRSKMTTSSIMLLVVIALLPTTGFGIYNFGFRALLIVLISVGSAVLTEFLFGLIKHKTTIFDLSAVVTGLLLALNLPVTVPLWLPAMGSVFAILVVKCLFGGLGQNFMNPALAGRCFLIISFPKFMTNFVTDAYTGATPLQLIKENDWSNVNVLNMVIGKTAGTIGETSMLAITIGACILILFGVIDLYVPGSIIVSFVIFYVLFAGEGFNLSHISAELAGGGLMLGAFFMATDYVTRPITPKGQVIFGIFIGLMIAIFRVFGQSAEGVSYAIILGNLLKPLIDKISVPTPFGYKKGGKA